MAFMGLATGSGGAAFVAAPSPLTSPSNAAAPEESPLLRQAYPQAAGATCASGVRIAAGAATVGFVTATLASVASSKRNGKSRRALKLARRALTPERSERGNSAPTSARAVKAAAPELITSVDPLSGPDGTYQVGIDFQSWLQSATEEIQVGNLRVEGKLPAWLRGHLVHAGPAKFEFGDDEFVDWVDGQAMLYRLRIDASGNCEYRNRWLNTWNHRMHREAGRIAVRETCSRPTLPNLLDRIMYMFNPPNNENGNLHISRMVGGARPVSMSVGSAILEWTLDDMETLGKVNWQDELCEGGPLIFHAEPHTDNQTGEWYTCAIQLKVSTEAMGLKPEYVVYSVKPTESREAGAPVKRNLLTRIETDRPAPIHTIGMTDQYLVLIQIPYPLNWDGMLNAEARWLMTGKYEGNLNDYNTWRPDMPTQIRLVNRHTGEQTAIFEADPFFFFHVCNCYEDIGGESGSDPLVHADVVCYNEPPVGFPLRQARSGDVEDWRGGGGEVRRLTMNLATGQCSTTGWPDNCFDEPKINPKVDGVKHKYTFGLVDYYGTLRLTRIDHETREQIYWQEQDISRELPWQPVFVPEPYNDAEDAGVVLSFVRDQPTGNTFCVVVDAHDFKELARIHLPEGHHIPLHGHGDWMPLTA